MAMAPAPKLAEQLKLLIVDDNDGMRSSLRRVLQLDHYQIDEANSVAAALQRDNWSDYFAILLDRKMPDGTADELLPKVRALAPEAAVMIITGYADLESSVGALRLGAADYLLKPIEPESLRSRLRGFASLFLANRELVKRDAQLCFMVEHLPAAAAYVEIHSGEVRFNQMIEQITGYTPDRFSTKDACFELLFGDRAASIQDRYDRNLASWLDEPRRLRIQRRDGVQRIVEFRGYRYSGREVWLLDDVTDRDLHETELRIRDQAIQSVNESIVIADANQPGYPIVFVNKAFERLSGLTAAEAHGQGCNLLCGDSTDPAFDGLKQAIENHRDFRDTVQCVRADGSRFWNEISLAPVCTTFGKVSHIVAVMEDVSERIDAQNQVLQSERLAAIGEMVTGLAHESRNALQRSQACLDMLALDLEDQPEQLELTNKIRRAMDDLHRHYEEVRNYAAPINLEWRPTDVLLLIRQTWQNVEPARSGRVFQMVEAGDVCDTVCEVDEHRIEQVFRNVLENAIAACSETGRVIITLSGSNQSQEPSLQISIRDNGPGFTKESAENVFMPFFTTKQKGTGLGMAICKRIVEAHGGRIDVASHHDGGEVIIVLPQQKTRDSRTMNGS